MPRAARRRPPRFPPPALPERAAAGLRVVTFNLHHGVGPDRRLDLERSAALLASLAADVIGLQEVDRHWSERSGWLDQAETLARWLGMHLAYGAALEREPPAPGRPPRRYGNALLTRLPLVSRSVLRLPRDGMRGEDRCLLLCAVDGDEQVTVGVTHLEPHRAELRALQAAAVADALRPPVDAGEPVVLLGDVNGDVGRDPELRPLRDLLADAGRRAGPTHPVPRATKRIDVVMPSRGIEVLRAEVVDARVSDHRPLVAELRLPGG